MNYRRFPTPPNPPTPAEAPAEDPTLVIAAELRCASGPWVEPSGDGRLLLTRSGEYALQLAAELAFGGLIAEVNEGLRSRGIGHLVTASLRYTTTTDR